MPPSAMRSIASVIATSTFAYSVAPTPLPLIPSEPKKERTGAQAVEMPAEL